MIAAAPVSMLAVYSDGGGAPLLLGSGIGDALEREAFERGLDDRRRFREGLSGFSKSAPSAVAERLGDSMDDEI